ncbi:MAG TPA: SDR family NAD(P)-dependent oxidoreductase [Chthoniobacterales bacterium]|nr:SDR family NAD(P)-dependent oxidoreductase [Chthoniobacterales bacterium]
MSESYEVNKNRGNATACFLVSSLEPCLSLEKLGWLSKGAQETRRIRVYGGTKAYVIGFTHSLQHELSGKGIRVQAVLPGATATEFWDSAGYSHQNLPKEIVTSADDLVDAAAGFEIR